MWLKQVKRKENQKRKKEHQHYKRLHCSFKSGLWVGAGGGSTGEGVFVRKRRGGELVRKIDCVCEKKAKAWNLPIRFGETQDSRPPQKTEGGTSSRGVEERRRGWNTRTRKKEIMGVGGGGEGGAHFPPKSKTKKGNTNRIMGREGRGSYKAGLLLLLLCVRISFTRFLFLFLFCFGSCLLVSGVKEHSVRSRVGGGGEVGVECAAWHKRYSVRSLDRFWVEITKMVIFFNTFYFGLCGRV